jgi:2,5-diamino-6-(ribosylamino)-4(3H)-pyrimidinone 5'-phosphate reductase
MPRPFTFINVAVTADGKIDTFERRGAAISSPQDKQRVDRLRADSDAVMVGGRTLLGEDPSLTVKSEALRAERVARGLEPNPVKVGIVSHAQLDPQGKFFSAGPARVVIFTTSQTSRNQLEALRSRGAEVVVLGEKLVDLNQALEILYEKGIRRLMVEGGSTINFELLQLGLVDELTLYVAPLIFGGASAPSLAGGSGLLRDQAIELELLNIEKWEDGGLVLHYRPRRAS